MAKKLDGESSNLSTTVGEAKSLEQGIAAALGASLWSKDYFGVRLDRTKDYTISSASCKALLTALDVGPLTVKGSPEEVPAYVQKLQQAWESDKPILPYGLYILFGSGESGKSATLLRSAHTLMAKYGDVEKYILDIGDVNSELAAPIGNNDSLVEFLDEVTARAKDITSSDDRFIFVDSLSWYDDIPMIASSPAKKNGAPKAWEEYLKLLHRFFVSQELVCIATMNPNDEWAEGRATQLQALYSSIAGAFDMASGRAWVRYKRKDGVEPRFETTFDREWHKGSAPESDTAKVFYDEKFSTILPRPSEL